MSRRNNGKLNFGWSIALIVLPILTALCAICIGRIAIAPADVFSALLGKLGIGGGAGKLIEMTVLNLRLPRILSRTAS